MQIMLRCFLGNFTQLAQILHVPGRDGRDKYQLCSVIMSSDTLMKTRIGIEIPQMSTSLHAS